MKYVLVLILFSATSACNHNPTQNELDHKLQSTMRTYLYGQINNDSSKVKYRMIDVTYFPEEKEYICEFKVKMLVTGKPDTTGIMRAYISKDFSKVRRMY